MDGNGSVEECGFASGGDSDLYVFQRAGETGERAGGVFCRVRDVLSGRIGGAGHLCAAVTADDKAV